MVAFFSRAFKWIVAHSGLISALTHCRGIQLSPLTPLHATFLNAMLDSGLTRDASTTVLLNNIQKWITPTAERHVTLFTLQRRLHLQWLRGLKVNIFGVNPMLFYLKQMVFRYEQIESGYLAGLFPRQYDNNEYIIMGSKLNTQICDLMQLQVPLSVWLCFSPQ